MSDFSDRPFVAGSLIGLRAFDLDAYGRLIGPSVRQVFRPDENEAECRKEVLTFRASWYPSQPAIMMPSYTFDPATGDITTSGPMRAVETDEPTKSHNIGSVSCSCGFYAYFDGRNDYKKPGNVAAIIEGYGICTVGSRGFRASKARLVALVQPKKSIAPLMLDRLNRNYPDVPIYSRKAEAVAAHPLTPPPEPTPADEDFWTRPAVTR